MTNIICNECETVAHCMKNGCVPKQQALDKMADNARELGLDYESDGMHHNKPIIKSYLEKDNSAQPLVVPDLLTTWDSETPEYRNGWNDCRQLMMEMYRKEIK